MAWRLAHSLVQLRAEINTVAPERSKASDGTIGDTSHSSRCSRHNPNNAGVVCAFDGTNDPAHGMPIHTHADIQVGLKRMGQGHPDLEYVISNGRVASRSSGWQWRVYTGSNPHKLHAHFAVGRGSDCEPTPTYDSPNTWGIAPLPPPAPAPAPPTWADKVRALPQQQRGSTGQYVRNLQGLLNAHGNSITVDGDFGDRTEAVLRWWQARTGVLTADGICGANTWAWLIGNPPTLKVGASGQDVRDMQGLLVGNGQLVAVDGAFGPRTELGLKAWQGRAGLSADGICGPRTWSALVGVPYP